VKARHSLQAFAHGPERWWTARELANRTFGSSNAHWTSSRTKLMRFAFAKNRVLKQTKRELLAEYHEYIHFEQLKHAIGELASSPPKVPEFCI